MTRIKHNLWRVSNGWIMVPENDNEVLSSIDAPRCVVFKTLKEFADNYPKRERKTRKPKPTQTQTITTTQ